MKTTTFFRHVVLGGAVRITDAPRSREFAPGVQPANTVATFSNDEAGQIALGAFIAGLRTVIGCSLFNEDTDQFDVGTVDQLDIGANA